MKSEKKTEQMKFLRLIAENTRSMEETRKDLRTTAQNYLKSLKEYLALADKDDECIETVKALQERLFGLL